MTTELNCWEWPGAKTYGDFRVKSMKSKMKAHRAMWELWNDKNIPFGMEVMHKCDNPKCFNPAHLSLGTHKQNMEDRKSKGRGGYLKGASNGRAVLSEAQVIEIRNSPDKNASLARKYNVSKVLIGNIKKRKLWKHI